MGHMEGLQGSLSKQAFVLQVHRDYDGAMALLQEQEKICREHGFLEGLVQLLTMEALHYGYLMHRPREALKFADEAFMIATRCGYTRLIEDADYARAQLREMR